MANASSRIYARAREGTGLSAYLGEPATSCIAANARLLHMRRVSAVNDPNDDSHNSADRPKPRKVYDWGTAYCKALAISGQKRQAAEAAHVTLRAVQKRRQTHPAFAAEERRALCFAMELLEDEVIRRAVEGIERKTFDSKGNVTSAWRD